MWTGYGPWWLLYPAHASVTSCVTWCRIGCFLPWPPIPLPLCWLLCPQQQPYYPTHDRKHFRDGIAWLHHCWWAPACCLGSVLLPLPFFWLSISTCHLSPWGLRIPYEWSTLVSFYTSPLHPLWGKMQRQKSKANGWQLLALSIAIFQDVPQIPHVAEHTLACGDCPWEACPTEECHQPKTKINVQLTFSLEDFVRRMPCLS